MEWEQLMKTGMDLVYLARCALHGEPPKAERVEAMDLEAVYNLAREHSMTAVTCYALEYLWGNNCVNLNPQPPVIQEWLNEKRVAIRKNIALDMEREKLLAHLEQIGCWYMPLKGSLLQELYPRAGMRQMGDNDILVDPVYRGRIEAYMIQAGYEPEHVGTGYHDAYVRKPFHLFEIHGALFGKTESPVLAGCYENVKQRLHKDEGNSYGYHFSREDFYVYLMAHAAKHYHAGGNGLRSLMDVHTFCNAMESEMDWGYVEGEVHRIGIQEYERSSRELAVKLFGEEDRELSKEQKEMLLFCASCGTYGKWENRIDRLLTRNSKDSNHMTVLEKLYYCVRRIVPPLAHYEENMPFVYRHKILLPFAAVYAVVRRLIVKRKQIWPELKEVLKRR